VLHVVGYLLPGLTALIMIPMALGIAPPNGLYGFRTPKTLSSPNIWYPANRVSGWILIGASLLTICFNLILWRTHPEWPEKRLILWMANSMVVALLAGLAASLLYLRRL